MSVNAPPNQYRRTFFAKHQFFRAAVTAPDKNLRAVICFILKKRAVASNR